MLSGGGAEEMTLSSFIFTFLETKHPNHGVSGVAHS